MSAVFFNNRNLSLVLGIVGAISSLCLTGACTGLEGTINITVVTAPDSDLRERVVRVRVTSSDPQDSVEVERNADGSFTLTLDLVASGGIGTVTLEGFDATGALVAYGRSAPLPIQAVNADVTIYVAPPMSLSEAPIPMTSARSELGLAVLPYGAALVGGREADGQLSAAMDIYNVYSHEFQIGAELPAPRARITAIAGASSGVYLFGGENAEGRDSSTAWRFDTGIPPAGDYAELSTSDTWARSGAAAAVVGAERFMLTGGANTLVIDGLTATIGDVPQAPELSGTATSIIFDGAYFTVFVGAGNGPGGGYTLHEDEFTALDESTLSRTGHSTVVLPDATTLTLGGQVGAVFDRAGVVVDPRSGDTERRQDLLEVGRVDAAIAATPEYVLVAGGLDRDGFVVPDAEILAASDLAPVATLPMLVPRHGAQAVALANGQIGIFGGLDSTGAPVATIELLTPQP